MMTQLRMLWKTGADAKHRGQDAAKMGKKSAARREFKNARMAWEKALKMQPGNRGFQESLAKLEKG